MADPVPCRCLGDCGLHYGHCEELVGQPFDPKHLANGVELWFTVGLVPGVLDSKTAAEMNLGICHGATDHVSLPFVAKALHQLIEI
jgi:hypothetical protein